MKIHLSQYKLYSADEMRHYVDSGLISLEGASESDFKGFCDKLLSEAISLEQYERGCEAARDAGYNEGYYEGGNEE